MLITSRLEPSRIIIRFPDLLSVARKRDTLTERERHREETGCDKERQSEREGRHRNVGRLLEVRLLCRPSDNDKIELNF